jgi:hypothetical protein
LLDVYGIRIAKDVAEAKIKREEAKKKKDLFEKSAEHTAYVRQ